MRKDRRCAAQERLNSVRSSLSVCVECVWQSCLVQNAFLNRLGLEIFFPSTLSENFFFFFFLISKHTKG